ncbi:MAG TPA: hypothetical protein VEA38_13830 [Terriglobales bacterium]|nr:hypothetical protein [Terriglobales bacterium]
MSRCTFGFHDWRQSREIAEYDTWPIEQAWERPTRTCRRCGRLQWWLPGYGGSEAGCWMNARAVPPVEGA